MPDLWTAYAAKYPGKDPKWSFLPSDAEALSKINAGFRADVLHPCSAFVQDYVAPDLFQPWDTSLITNFADLNPALVEAGVVDGQQYVIPEDWGFISILYDKDDVEPDGEPSWNLLFDKRYDQKITLVRQRLRHDGHRRLRGRGGRPVEHDRRGARGGQGQVHGGQAVRAHVLERAGRHGGRLQGRQHRLTYAWPSSWVLMQKEGKNVEYMDPKEGRLAFLCGFSLFKDTENYVHAHDYVDAWSSPESASGCSTTTPTGTPTRRSTSRRSTRTS